MMLSKKTKQGDMEDEALGLDTSQGRREKKR
jgi:hypothetical protein